MNHHVAKRDDLGPGNFRMVRLRFRLNTGRSLTDNRQLVQDGCPGSAIGHQRILVLATHVPDDRVRRFEDVQEE